MISCPCCLTSTKSKPARAATRAHDRTSVPPSASKRSLAQIVPAAVLLSHSQYCLSPSWSALIARPRRQSARSFSNTAGDAGDELCDLGRCRPHPHAAGLQGLLLGL